MLKKKIITVIVALIFIAAIVIGYLINNSPVETAQMKNLSHHSA